MLGSLARYASNIKKAVMYSRLIVSIVSNGRNTRRILNLGTTVYRVISNGSKRISKQMREIFSSVDVTLNVLRSRAIFETRRTRRVRHARSVTTSAIRAAQSSRGVSRCHPPLSPFDRKNGRARELGDLFRGYYGRSRGGLSLSFGSCLGYLRARRAPVHSSVSARSGSLWRSH